jgi:hypothetical protein
VGEVEVMSRNGSWAQRQFGAPYPRRSLGNLLGIYRREGKWHLGRAPYLSKRTGDGSNGPVRCGRSFNSSA